MYAFKKSLCFNLSRFLVIIIFAFIKDSSKSESAKKLTRRLADQVRLIEGRICDWVGFRIKGRFDSLKRIGVLSP